MRIYVTGGGGAIGRTLIPALRKKGHEVIALTRSESKRAALESLGAQAIIADALDADALTQSLITWKPEVVINQLTALSAGLNMRDFDKSFEMTNRLRTLGTDNLLKAAVKAGVKRVVSQSFGGGWIYEPAGGRLKIESDALDPNPPRDARKTLAAIRHLEHATLNTPGIEGVVLRYGFFYGPGTSVARDGEVVRDVQKRRVPLVGDAAGVWSFCHIEDAGTLTALAAERGRPGIYNVVDDEPAEVSVWLPELARALGAPAPMRIPTWMARFAIGPNALSVMTRIPGVSNEKAKKEFDWNPIWRSWRDGFQRRL